MDLRSLLILMMEEYKKEINNSLKEIQENTSKHVKELNKTIKDLKMEVETITKGNHSGNRKARKEIRSH
jgi:gas vesicle protein